MYGLTILFEIGGYINMKKIFAFVLALVMVACMLVGCRKAETAYDSEKDGVVKVQVADLAQIPGYDYLYYSTTDRTVYYYLISFETRCFGPKIINGHYCEYRNGQIIEVIPTVRIEDATN